MNENRQARTEKLKEGVRDKTEGGGRILIKIISSCEILKKMSKKMGQKRVPSTKMCHIYRGTYKNIKGGIPGKRTAREQS